MEYKNLKVQIEDGIAIVTNNRPETLNALNSNFFREINDVMDRLSADKSVRIMILTGEGKAFAAGADISEMVNMTPEEGKAFSQLGQRIFRRFFSMEIPVIAAINGFALGGGLELTLGCDIRIASSNAKFGQPEVNLGMIPGYGGTQRLPRLIGLGNALYLLLTAERIGAEEALRMGLVQKVVEPELLMEEAMKIARTILSKGPEAIRKVKFVTRTGIQQDFITGCELESEYFSTQFKAEGEEGMRAFLEKRKPEW
ncbi:MAG: enoyl-CoA hydratase-related protein [Bacteroidales bacterium]|nr:enoyl-CoA hydratase-related protein [Bacteroidales bacterium]